MENTEIYVTQEGLEKLITELNTLIEKRPEAVNMVRTSSALGDLSENAGYHAAQEDLAYIDRRIAELTETIKFAKVTTESGKKNYADVGVKVTLKDSLGKKVVYYLVGVSEADPMKFKISYQSPIGKAIFKKKIGEKAVVQTPIGQTTFEIINLE